MYIALAVTFLADAYGLNLSASDLGTVLLTTLIASKRNHAGTVLTITRQ
ncbi:hypothetical protein V2K35_10625 [Pseudomonas alliivorans]|nr:hypothetical protein [Pseudomonas alliivorans]MEE4873650.1 hypothetical protein [Pseudomonas alliivorans]